VFRVDVLFVHPQFPAQFGHIASYLVDKSGCRVTFVSRSPAGVVAGIEKIQYQLSGGATMDTHFCSRPFENAIWHCDAVYKALKARPDIQPDMIVGHSGFGSTLFLRELYPQVPVVNLFEYFYNPDSPDSDMNFRHDLDSTVEDVHRQRARCRNAMTLLDLNHCTTAYTPTRFQHSLFPKEYAGKLQVVHSGVDRAIFHSDDDRARPELPLVGMRQVAGVSCPTKTRIITYASRGFESIRGFDLFLRSAKLLLQRHPDVLFFIVGNDRAGATDYENLGEHKTFKEWALAQEEYDLTKFVFTGQLRPPEMAELFRATDLHIYLTVPYVLSGSVLEAMSCGAVVLGSNTAPVREIIADGQNGILVDFFDVEAIAAKAAQVLEDPVSFRSMGRLAEQTIIENYSLEVVLPQLVNLYRESAAAIDRVSIE
jgi:glycosyltransferase involved in cell wall biosynthesis